MTDDDLRHLPHHTEEPRAAERARRVARAAFLASFAPSPWHAPFGRAQRLLTPVVLATFVGLYLTWAILSAAAVVQ